MNVLKTLDKSIGTSNGKILDIEWKKRLKAYYEGGYEMDLKMLEKHLF